MKWSLAGLSLEIMVGQRGETPLVPPYRFRSPNLAMALLMLQQSAGRSLTLPFHPVMLMPDLAVCPACRFLPPPCCD